MISTAPQRQSTSWPSVDMHRKGKARLCAALQRHSIGTLGEATA
nr:MAG TPA: hypothetical protein [Caudoviricetes sp.]